MINDAHVFLSGYVATDPVFKRLNGTTPTAKLRIAYTSRRMNRETGEWSDGPTSFVSVQCWRALAQNVAVCLRKGEPVLVKGRLQVRQYANTQGESRLAVEVDASSIGHDLTRGVAHFSRTHRAVGGTAAENGSSPAAEQQDAESGDAVAGGAVDGGAVDGGAVDGGAVDGVDGGAEPGGQSPDGPAGAGPAPAGPGSETVLNERAVAEFARQLSEPLGEDQGEDQAGTEPAEADRQLSVPT